jgi:hypothetical protein
VECGECQKFSPQGGDCSVTPVAELARDTDSHAAATVANCK